LIRQAADGRLGFFLSVSGEKENENDQHPGQRNHDQIRHQIRHFSTSRFGLFRHRDGALQKLKKPFLSLFLVSCNTVRYHNKYTVAE